MPTFRNKTIRGATYDLSHLEPFVFPLTVSYIDYRVRVTFGCHVFTEKLRPEHTPDLRYTYKGEDRAFDVGRYNLSKHLPGLIQSQNTHSVYHSRNEGSFFILKGVGTSPGNAPYAVFFRSSRYNEGDADVLVKVVSAYEKPKMTKFAQPVRFTNLVEALAKGTKPPLGPPAQIRRR